MPTVKLQNGKVLLKDGKVSCTCCEGPECCPYPADMLGAEGGYTAADLPDAITTIDPALLAFISISRTGTTYETLDNKGGPITLEHTVDGWKLTYFIYPDQGDDPPEIYTNTEDCLIGDYNDGSHFVEDQFADCYEVTWNDDGSRSANVTRDDECNWTGTDNESGSVRLRYNPTTTKWEVIASLGKQPKDSNQSAPDAGAGTYSDYTVTEC